MLNELSVADIEAVIDGALYREARLDDRAARLAAHLLCAGGAKLESGDAVTPEALIGRDLLTFDPRDEADAPPPADPAEADDRIARAHEMLERAQLEAQLGMRGAR